MTGPRPLTLAAAFALLASPAMAQSPAPGAIPENCNDREVMLKAGRELYEEVPAVRYFTVIGGQDVMVEHVVNRRTGGMSVFRTVPMVGEQFPSGYVTCFIEAGTGWQIVEDTSGEPA